MQLLQAGPSIRNTWPSPRLAQYARGSSQLQHIGAQVRGRVKLSRGTRHKAGMFLQAGGAAMQASDMASEADRPSRHTHKTRHKHAAVQVGRQQSCLGHHLGTWCWCAS